MQVSDDTFAYFSAARGFKSGGSNPGVPGEAVNPEFAWSYEGGVKRTIAGVEVEAAASGWRGVQLAAPEWSGSGPAAYEFATGRAGFTSVRCDVSGQSRVFFTPFNTAIET
jgi:hypothetical protein